MKAWAICATNLRLFVRDRTNVFFVFVFPLALVLLIGVRFGGDDDPRLGVVLSDGTTAEAIVDELDSAEVDVVLVDDRSALVDRVESTDLAAGIVLPEGLDVAATGSPPAAIEFIARPDGVGPLLRSVVTDAIAVTLAEPTAVGAAVERGADRAAAEAAAARLAGTLGAVEVRTVTAGDRLFPEGTAGFDVAAPSQLVLFMFTTGLSGTAALILTRKLGLSARMLSTPTSARTVILGEALGRITIGLVQGTYILVATLVLFGVTWGDPIGAAALLVAFAAVSAGAAMLLGTLLDNEEVASGVGIVLSLGLAALGGAMLPIELFGDTLATVARATPHYWAIDAFAELVRHDGSVVDIGQQLGVLAAFAAALLLVASWRMGRVLARPT